MSTGQSDDDSPESSLHLIQEEIAIMKKLYHQNLVSLIEALDDPEGDSLYMVLELCKKGVIMKVGIGEVAEPYDPEVCRCWFRDLILGLEYREYCLTGPSYVSNTSQFMRKELLTVILSRITSSLLPTMFLRSLILAYPKCSRRSPI